MAISDERLQELAASLSPSRAAAAASRLDDEETGAVGGRPRPPDPNRYPPQLHTQANGHIVPCPACGHAHDEHELHLPKKVLEKSIDPPHFVGARRAYPILERGLSIRFSGFWSTLTFSDKFSIFAGLVTLGFAVTLWAL